MFGGVTAPMEIESERGRSLLKGLAKQVDSAHDQRHGLEHTITSAAFHSGLIRVHFAHEILKIACERIALPRVLVEIREYLLKTHEEERRWQRISKICSPPSKFR